MRALRRLVKMSDGVALQFTNLHLQHTRAMTRPYFPILKCTFVLWVAVIQSLVPVVTGHVPAVIHNVRSIVPMMTDHYQPHPEFSRSTLPTHGINFADLLELPAQAIRKVSSWERPTSHSGRTSSA